MGGGSGGTDGGDSGNGGRGGRGGGGDGGDGGGSGCQGSAQLSHAAHFQKREHFTRQAKGCDSHQSKHCAGGGGIVCGVSGDGFAVGIVGGIGRVGGVGGGGRGGSGGSDGGWCSNGDGDSAAKGGDGEGTGGGGGGKRDGDGNAGATSLWISSRVVDDSSSTDADHSTKASESAIVEKQQHQRSFEVHEQLKASSRSSSSPSSFAVKGSW